MLEGLTNIPISATKGLNKFAHYINRSKSLNQSPYLNYFTGIVINGGVIKEH